MYCLVGLFPPSWSLQFLRCSRTQVYHPLLQRLPLHTDTNFTPACRFIIGVGCGVATVAVPLYLGEIGAPHQKNRLGIANQGFIVMGVFSAQAFAIPLSRPYIWRLVPLVSAVLSVILLITSFMIKESPIWLKKRGEQGRRAVNNTPGELESLLSGEGEKKLDFRPFEIRSVDALIWTSPQSEPESPSESLSIPELFSTTNATIRNGCELLFLLVRR